MDGGARLDMEEKAAGPANSLLAELNDEMAMEFLVLGAVSMKRMKSVEINHKAASTRTIMIITFCMKRVKDYLPHMANLTLCANICSKFHLFLKQRR